MSIQTTPFLHLPQWSAEEQPSFLGEINPAWAAIDTGYGDIKASAGTAITTANAAVGTANASKQQSEANAGAITRLEQMVEALKNQVNSAGNLTVAELPVTVMPEWQNILTTENISSYVRYNNYCAEFEIHANIKTNLNIATPANGDSLNIAGIPFTFSAIRCVSDIALVHTGTLGTAEIYKIIQGAINSNGVMFVGLNGGLQLVTGTTPIEIGFNFSLPIYRAANTRDIADNCLYLPATT